MSVIRKILNIDGVALPWEKPQQQTAKPTTRTPRRTGRRAASPASADPGVNEWITAGQEVAAQNAADAVPWQSEIARTPVWRRIMHMVLIAAAAVVLLVGLRTMFFPQQVEQAVPEIDPALSFPQAIASETAERFTASYLTWDEEHPETRAAALALDVPTLDEAGLFGWDRQGVQDVIGTPHTIELRIDGATSATATVVARIETVVSAEESVQRWTALSVPLAVEGERVVISGPPSTIAVPAPPKTTADQPSGVEDRAVTNSTAEYGEAFFTAFGRDTDVSSMTAPGAEIFGLGGALTFSEITSWIVYEGKGTTRTARAEVVWVDAAGTKLTNTYRLRLEQVSGSASTRWQISAITTN